MFYETNLSSKRLIKGNSQSKSNCPFFLGVVNGGLQLKQSVYFVLLIQYTRPIGLINYPV